MNARTGLLWAIADLHLPGAAGKGPDAAGGAAPWRDGPARLEAGWRALVGPADVVLVPGDISLARGHRDVQPDLAWLDRLPGTKVLAPGNHDRWWNRVDAVRPLLRRSLRAVEGDALDLGGLVVCGARGARVPAEDAPRAQHDAYAREVDSLARALEAAAALRGDGDGRPLYVLWHFPPFDAHGRPGAAVALWEAAGASAVVYGHAHREGQWSSLVQGVRGGVRYAFVAANAIGFHPLKLGPLAG